MSQLREEDRARLPEILTKIATETGYRGPWHIRVQRGSEGAVLWGLQDEIQAAVELALQLAATAQPSAIITVEQPEDLYVALTLQGHA